MWSVDDGLSQVSFAELSLFLFPENVAAQVSGLVWRIMALSDGLCVCVISEKKNCV